MTTGSWQHYLPATYLAGFSSSPATRARKSVLWVARRGRGSLFQQTAENLAARHNMYTIDARYAVGRMDPNQVDQMWAPVEAKLATSIAHLGGSDAVPLGADWFANLVQFLAHVFARAVDFAARLPNRIGDTPNLLRDRMLDPSNVNVARMLECQRLLAPMLVAEWDVLHSADEPFLTNDMGRVPTLHAGPPRRLGCVVPLRADLAVALYPGNGPRLIWDPGRATWTIASLTHVLLTRQEVRSLNASVAGYARDEVYGGDREVVVAAAGDFSSAPRVHQLDEPVFLRMSPREARRREHEFFKFVQAISSGPSGEQANVSGLALWNAPVFFPSAPLR